MLTLEQQAKWQELDTFFKTNSKYYKQLDNDDVVFNVWGQGAGGDFLVNLFLDIIIDIDLYLNEIVQYIQKFNRYQQTIPCIESRLHNSIWLENSSLHESFNTKHSVVKFQKQHELTDYVYNLYMLLELPNIEIFNVVDELFKIAVTDEREIKKVHHFKLHTLAIIPYFYYKNSEKLKTIILGYTKDQTLRTYMDALQRIKRDNLLDKTTGKIRYDNIPPSVSSHQVNEINAFFNEVISTTKNEDGYYEYHNVANGVIAELFLASLDEHQYDVSNIKQTFLTYIKSYIQKLETLDFNYINNQENDDWYSLTAKPYSDMMDFLPTNQVCKIDYRKLFFEHDDATIKQMMQLYNSNQDILYYKTQIQLYHERNIKLFNQLKTELPLAVEKI